MFDWFRKNILGQNNNDLATNSADRQVSEVNVGEFDNECKIKRKAIEEILQVAVNDLRIYEQALTHRSSLRGKGNTHYDSNERLEFLGDAVLGMVAAEYLYKTFPKKDEGFLTRVRSKIVKGKALAGYAKKISLGQQILMSHNTYQSGGRENDTILADAFEGIIGALYIDQGFDVARTFVLRIIDELVDVNLLAERRDNFKSLLLEFVQARGWPQPIYQVVNQVGPSHNRRFTIEVVVQQQVYGIGEAGSKKQAEQIAAKSAVLKLRDEIARS